MSPRKSVLGLLVLPLNVELEGSMDYVATGLPRAGDEVPAGEQRFLDDASPWSLSALAVVPVAPLDP